MTTSGFCLSGLSWGAHLSQICPTVDSFNACSDKCVSVKRNSTCPHDEHHYNDDEFSSPQLGSLTNLLHRHLIWSGNTDRLRVNKVPLRTFIVLERRCEIAIALTVYMER